MDLRATARQIFLESLARVDLRLAIPEKVRRSGTRLHIEEITYNFADFSQIVVIGIGKAAVSMAEHLLRVVTPLLTSAHTLRGRIIGATLPSQPDPRLPSVVGAHPLPDSRSIQAAIDILKLLADTTEDTLVFFLISGGASAMADLPLDPAIPLADLIAFHGALVHSGLSIGDMNTLRKHISAIKGGRLAVAAQPATQCTLLVSDVPPSRTDIIASGPTLPDPSTLADCRRLLASALAHSHLPASIHRLLQDPQTPETPKAGHPAFARANVHTLLSSDDLVQAADAVATAHGFRTAVDLTPDDWPFDQAAAHLFDHLQHLARTYPEQPVCLISAGELAVPITSSKPGMGGRNQHFALHCALRIGDATQPTAVLSAGSDGVDGNSPAAGAVVDQTTVPRAQQQHFDPAGTLADFNSYALLHTLGDTILTGPTGNNLRDLRLLLAMPSPHR